MYLDGLAAPPFPHPLSEEEILSFVLSFHLASVFRAKIHTYKKTLGCFTSPRLYLVGHTLVLHGRKTPAWKTDEKLGECLPAPSKEKPFPNPRNCVLRRGGK